MANVIIAEPYDLARAGLTAMLEDLDGYRLVTVGRQLLDVWDTCLAEGVTPDLVVISSLETPASLAAAEVKSRGSKIVVVLRSTDEDELARGAALRGDGYVLGAQVSAETLRSVLDAALSGEALMPGALAQRLLGPSTSDLVAPLS